MFAILNIQINNQIRFKNVDIEDLTSENCLFLDEQNNDTFEDVVNAVKARTIEVINQNLERLGLEKLISGTTLYADDNIIEEDENFNESENTEDSNESSISVENSDELKENAKNKIIESVSQAMATAQSEGRAYTLEDLMNLEVDDVTSFTVSIGEDEAILDIDGFEFKINSEFQLYE